MSKLLEVIGKDDNLKENTSKLTILETTFLALGKIIGSEVGKNWTSIVQHDMLSQQALVSLNNAQSSIGAQYDAFATDHNSWVNGITKMSLSPVQSTMNVETWANGLIPNSTPAGHQQILFPLATQERKIFETPKVRSKNVFIINKSTMQEWSKTKPYADTVSSIKFYTIEITSNQDNWIDDDLLSSKVTWKWTDGSNDKKNGDKLQPVAHILSPMNPGEVARCKISHEYCTSDYVTLYCDDKGGGVGSYRMVHTTQGSCFDKLRDSIATYYNGNHASHFDTTSNEETHLNLPWFKSRILL